MEDKSIKKIISILLPSTTLLFLCCLNPSTISITSSILISFISLSIIGKEIVKLKKTDTKSNIKEQHYIQQLTIGLAEMDKKGTRINSMTPFFTNTIQRVKNEHKINIDEDTIQNINQFLYMINSNYYEKIIKYSENNPYQTREDVLNEICEAIFKYMELTNDYSFDDKYVFNILSTVSFINPKLKEEMTKEFENSRIPGALGKYHYIIERKDINETNIKEEYTKKFREITKEDVSFDIYEKDSYLIAIEKIKDMDYYKKLNNQNKEIIWDIDALMDISIQIIEKYNTEMERKIDKYSIARFVVKLIVASISYAINNKINVISYNEIINSFSNINNIPSTLKQEISEYLNEINKKRQSKETKEKVMTNDYNRKDQN